MNSILSFYNARNSLFILGVLRAYTLKAHTTLVEYNYVIEDWIINEIEE